MMGDMAELYDYLIWDDADEFEGCYDMSKYCLVCDGLMKTMKGKFGKFRGCNNYPNCQYTEDYQECGKIV